MSWLTTIAFGLPRYIWGALLIGILTAGVLWFVELEKADDKANQQIGSMTERAETTGQVLERVEQGNETRNEVEAEAARGTGGALYEQCVLAQRGDLAVCERFLPVGQTTER